MFHCQPVPPSGRYHGMSSCAFPFIGACRSLGKLSAPDRPASAALVNQTRSRSHITQRSPLSARRMAAAYRESASSQLGGLTPPNPRLSRRGGAARRPARRRRRGARRRGGALFIKRPVSSAFDQTEGRAAAAGGEGERDALRRRRRPRLPWRPDAVAQRSMKRAEIYGAGRRGQQWRCRRRPGRGPRAARGANTRSTGGAEPAAPRWLTPLQIDSSAVQRYCFFVVTPRSPIEPSYLRRVGGDVFLSAPASPRISSAGCVKPRLALPQPHLWIRPFPSVPNHRRRRPTAWLPRLVAVAERLTPVC